MLRDSSLIGGDRLLVDPGPELAFADSKRAGGRCLSGWKVLQVDTILLDRGGVVLLDKQAFGKMELVFLFSAVREDGQQDQQYRGNAVHGILRVQRFTVYRRPQLRCNARAGEVPHPRKHHYQRIRKVRPGRTVVAIVTWMRRRPFTSKSDVPGSTF